MMIQILEIFSLTLIITTVCGLPQNPIQEAEGILPIRQNLKEQRIGDPGDGTEDAQINTLPATVDFLQKDDLQKQNRNCTFRKVNEKTKPLDRSQVGTLPATIKFEDIEQKQLPREARDGDYYGSSEETNAETIKLIPADSKKPEESEEYKENFDDDETYGLPTDVKIKYQ